MCRIDNVLLISAQSEDVNCCEVGRDSKARYPTPDKCVGTRGGGDVWDGDGLWPPGPSVHHREDVGVALRLGKWAHQVHVRWPKRLSGAATRSKGVRTCLPTLLAWQSRHSRHQILMSLFMLCQTNLSDTARVVGTGPRWANPWMALNTSFRC